MNTPTEDNKGALVEADEPFIAIKSESGKWWRMPKSLPKSPSLLRRGARAAVVYALSYMVVKALDKARKENPGSEVISSVDDIAHAFFYFENLIVSGGVAIIKTGYDAVTSPQAVQETSAPLPAPTQKDALTAKIEPEKPVKHKRHPIRANLNASLAPDGLPAAGVPEAPTDARPRSQPQGLLP